MSDRPHARLMLDTPGPLHPAAASAMTRAIEDGWADPRRLHHEGRRARQLLDDARAVLASALGVAPEGLSLASNLPEAALAASDGLRYARRRVGSTIVVGAGEHSALVVPAIHRGRQPGRPAPVVVPLGAQGRIEMDVWRREVAGPGIAFAALQLANGEVGALQPILEADHECRRSGVPLVVDLSTTAGWLPTPGVGAVLLADAVGFGGPTLGLLAVRPAVRFRRSVAPFEAESGRLPMAPWVPVAMAAAAAWEATAAGMQRRARVAAQTSARLRSGLAAIDGVRVLGDDAAVVPHVVAFVVEGVAAEALASALDKQAIAVGAGSPCSANPETASHVLSAMGEDAQLGAVRVTFPITLGEAEANNAVDTLLRLIPRIIRDLRSMAG